MKHLTFLLFLFSLSFTVKSQPDGSDVIPVDNFPELKCGYEQFYSFKSAADNEGNFYVSGLFKVNGEYSHQIIGINSEREAVSFLETGPIYAISVQKDGKLLVAYNETDENGDRKGRIKRYNKDLTIDPTFSCPPLDLIFVINDAGIIKPADDAIYVGGHVLAEEQGNYSYLYKLNLNGSIDSSFTRNLAQFPFSGAYIYYKVLDIVLQEDGKLLVANQGLGENNSSELIRLNSDGSFDKSFVQNVDGGKIYTMERTENGKIMLAGNFTSYNGTQAHKIARINTDGNIDPSFDSGTGFGTNYSQYIYNVSSFSEGRILCQGRITSYNGTRVRSMVILEEDGQVWDQYTWNPFFNDMRSVYSVEKIDDNQIAVLSLSSNNNMKASVISNEDVLANSPFTKKESLSAFFNHEQLIISSPDPITYKILNTSGKVVKKGKGGERTTVNTAQWPTGVYIVVTDRGENLRVFKE